MKTVIGYIDMLKPKSTIHHLTRTSTPLTDDTLLMGTNGNETNAISLEEVKEYLGPTGTTDAIPLSQKGQPNGVPTLGSNGKIPSSQLPAISGGGGGGSGFIFEDLAEHVKIVTTPAEIEFFHMGQPPIFSGDNVLGSVTLSGEQVAISSFKVATETSYKIRLPLNGQIGIYQTKLKIDILNSRNPIEDAGGGDPITLTTGEDEISIVLGEQGDVISSAYTVEDWLKIVQTETELIWEINGNEIGRMPRDPDYTWVNVIQEVDEATPSSFEYDLTETVSDSQLRFDIESVADMVIYRSNHNLKILDRHVAIGDYVQLHDNKTKVIIYPQLSPIYDFDLSADANRIKEPVTISTTNPFITINPSQEPLKGSFVIPGWEVAGVDFENTATPATLEIFDAKEGDYGPSLELKQDFDPEGLITEIMAEFKLKKGYIHTPLQYGSSFGSASNIEYRIYAGIDRDKNYLSLKIIRYPELIHELSIVDENGVENLWRNLSSIDEAPINLKEFISLRTSSLSILSADTEDNYTKVLDFTDTDPNVTVQVFYSVSEAAATGLPSSYNLPFRNIYISIQSIRDYLNITPVEINHTSGNAIFKLEKQTTFFLYFVSADTLEEVFTKLLASNGDLAKAALMVKYNPDQDNYQYFSAASNATSKSGILTLAPDQDFTINVNKTTSEILLSVNHAGGILSQSGNGATKQKLFLMELGPALLGLSSSPDKNIEYDLSSVSAPSTVNLDLIQTRDRVRFTGGTITIAGQTINTGDIVEFFNGKNEILVTRNPETLNDKIIFLEVSAMHGDTSFDVRAWYDPIAKRIIFSGSFYYSGYGNNEIYQIIIPPSIRGKVSSTMSMGYFGNPNMTRHGGSIYTSDYIDYLSVQMAYTGGNYVSGSVLIPDSTVATVN